MRGALATRGEALMRVPTGERLGLMRPEPHDPVHYWREITLEEAERLRRPRECLLCRLDYPAVARVP